MSIDDSAPAPGRRLELVDHVGELAAGYEPRDIAGQIAELVEPESGGQTLHWGRNYLFVAQLELTTGPLEVVVKQFRNQGLKARWRRRRGGSKAQRSWRAARAVEAAGVPTPRPVLLLESRRPDGPSFYVSERVADGVEARYLFRAMTSGRMRELFPQVDEGLFFEVLGRNLRTLHDAGIWHRDASIGNLLVRVLDDGTGGLEVFLIDLNRARLGRRMSVVRRTRDLCRLPIVQAAHRDRFLRSYWRDRSDSVSSGRCG